METLSESSTGEPFYQANKEAHRFYLRKLDQECNKKLGGRFASFFDAPARSPRFTYLSPRDKSLQSPRFPGALHALYRQPEAQAVIANAWCKSLPSNERNLRRLLSERLPLPGRARGSPSFNSKGTLPAQFDHAGRLCSRPICQFASHSPRSLCASPDPPPDRLIEMREEQAQRLERLLRKVRPGKGPDAPLIRAAELRLKRLQEPLPVQEQLEPEVKLEEEGVVPPIAEDPELDEIPEAVQVPKGVAEE
ncbi:unnamed protein product [Durusdinium trenchii]|uniref:Uncharacterized protein n=1 Tax=Durusdinium trenchii TaxID=1381693 RepID=A0ABP0K4N0_9DINO